MFRKQDLAISLLLSALLQGCGETPSSAPATTAANQTEQKKSQALSNAPYTDPKGFFRLVPPAEWRPQEYPDDPRGKVAFRAPEGPTGPIDLRVLVSAKDFDDVDTLLAETNKTAEEIRARYRVEVHVEKTTFLSRPAVVRTFTMQGNKFLGYEFMDGNLRHDLQYSAPEERYDVHLDAVKRSMDTYESMKSNVTDSEIKGHVVANRLRLAKLFLDQGNEKLALQYVREGLELDPANAELMAMRKTLEN